MKNQQVVAYYRRSQDKKGQRHSLNAQRDGIETFCANNSLDIIAEFQDTQSGKDDNRVGLQNAVALAKIKGIPVIVLRVCRLGRKLSSLAALFEDSNLKIIIAELGMTADFLTCSILAATSAASVRTLSKRTKEGLAAAKKRGVILGNPNITTTALPKSNEANRARGKATVAKYGELIVSLRDGGLSWRKVASKLTDIGIPTPSKRGVWNNKTVANIYKAATTIR